jgi:Cdc6-like AAA superfamily ATPase
MVSIIASNPFTPKSGWEPGVFIGREKEIEFFRKKLVEAKKGRCDHFLVLGEWGIGKTSLLKECEILPAVNGWEYFTK